MRALIILAAISCSATAFAQSAPPKIGNKPLVQVKPKEAMGCKLVGTVKGTRLWAGDCIAVEPGSAISATTPPPLAEQAAGAIPPGQKQ
jgi:hypothetical protein